MKAIVHDEYGPPEDVLELRDIADPVRKDDEVLLRVHAAGVNWADWATTRGQPHVMRMVYGLRAPRNRVRGMDVAGTVEAVGINVKRLRPGDEVFGWCTGAFAELVRTKEGTLVPKPPGLTFEQAAAVPTAGFCALQALRDVAKVRPGQHVLVNGASGGIGTFAVQIAKVLGAEVTGVCSTRNLDLVRSLGADHVIDYAREDFTRSGQRYDLILDIADDRSLSERRRVLTPTGTLIPNSGVGGRWIGSVGRIVKARLLSPFVRHRLRPFLSLPRHKDLVTLAELIEAGDVAPVIDRTYALIETPEAVGYVGRGHARGKVVVTV
jgi:NADPH:quinone reductase-like Zn-dependent oxidoreductase